MDKIKQKRKKSYFIANKGETIEISKGFPLMEQYDDFPRGPLEFNLIPIDGRC